MYNKRFFEAAFFHFPKPRFAFAKKDFKKVLIFKHFQKIESRWQQLQFRTQLSAANLKNLKCAVYKKKTQNQ